MRILRYGSYLLFFGLVYLLYVQVKAFQADSAASENLRGAGDSSGAFMLILLFILTAVIGGLLFIPRILSYFGDQVGEAMMSSGEKAGDDPYAKAHAHMAAGEYELAIPAYRKISKEHPGDRMPILELVKIYQEKLLKPEEAVRILKSALHDEAQWENDDKAVFMFRLADLYLKDLHDQQGAVETLQEVATLFPHSRHAANATHKLREIDPALVAGTASSTAATATAPGKPDAPTNQVDGEDDSASA